MLASGFLFFSIKQKSLRYLWRCMGTEVKGWGQAQIPGASAKCTLAHVVYSVTEIHRADEITPKKNLSVKKVYFAEWANPVRIFMHCFHFYYINKAKTTNMLLRGRNLIETLHLHCKPPYFFFTMILPQSPNVVVERLTIMLRIWEVRDQTSARRRADWGYPRFSKLTH